MRISDWSSDVCSSDLLLETLTGRLAKIDRGLLQIGTRAPFVAIGRGSDDAQSSIAAYVHPRTRVDRARNVERQAVGALQNGRSGVQELHGDALKAGAAPVRKGNTALERLGQLRRHIARSVVKARPVGIAAIIGIAMLPGRFGIGRAAAADLQIAFGRARLGREVDNAADEFTRKVGGKTFLHQR